MNSCDKQTKWLIAIILVGSGLIIGGFIGAYDAIDNTREELKNEATLQKPKSKSVSLTPVADLDSNLLRSTVQRQQPWPDVTEGQCLLVNVPAPHNQPDKLTPDNTVRIPYGLCYVFIETVQELMEEGLLSYEGILFTPNKSF